jgi:alpha-L-fucosidase
MKAAVEKRGLKFMVSMHHHWLWGWYATWNENSDAADPANASLYGPKLPPTAQKMALGGGKVSNKNSYPLPSDEFQDTWLEKVKEVVSKYSPDLLWFDNRMEILREDIRAEMAAFYYNTTMANGQEPVLTYKRPDLVQGTATIDLERSRMPDIFPEPWLTDTSVSKGSWAYATDLYIYPTNRLIDDLADIVSKNGCLLLNVAPHPDGTIPEDQKQRLLEMGKWLKLNGEAIYGSRPWLVYGEGPTETLVGHLADLKFDGFSDKDIRFTTNNGILYAIALGWPEDDTINIQYLGSARYSGPVKGVQLVGHKGDLKFNRTPEGLQIKLPKKKPCEHAFVFRIIR